MNRWHALFMVILVWGSSWLWISRAPIPVQPALAAQNPAVGLVAPDFTLETLDGTTFQLSELRGTPLVLNFWATWCGPCIRELPALQTAAERYGNRVLIVGIDQGEPEHVVRPYVEEMGLTFPIPLDINMEVGQRYEVRGMPTTYFVDADGVIRHVWLGEMNSITLAEGIAKIWR
jgi:cytochrome c biogenesis protein CcmG, thiol:disulfide interchange protein DsbE